MSSPEYILTVATCDDTRAIVNLLNIAYRGNQGWTTEKQWVAGDRATFNDISRAIQCPQSVFLLLTVRGSLCACIALEQAVGNSVYIGSFAVEPAMQGAGLGKHLLSAAEEYAQQHWQCNQSVMTVISQRRELIDFYLRRGYQRKGSKSDYPLHANVGTPKSKQLTVEQLKKRLS